MTLLSSSVPVRTSAALAESIFTFDAAACSEIAVSNLVVNVEMLDCVCEDNSSYVVLNSASCDEAVA